MKTGLLFAIVFICGMCTNTKTNNLSSTDTAFPVEEIVFANPDENVVFSEEERVVDTIGKYQIIYRIVYTGKIFYSNNIAYADKDIVLTVKNENIYILKEKRFDRTDFASIISPLVMNEILLWRGRILNVRPGSIEIGVSATIPETDLLYDIRLTVHDDGQVIISGEEVVMEEE